MLNLLSQFHRIYLTGSDGVPHRLVPFLGAQEILPPGDNEEVLFPLTLAVVGTLSPSSGVTGTVFTYRPPVYTGSGPIAYESFFSVGGQMVNPITGQPTSTESEAVLIGPGPFTFTSRVAQFVEAITVATGADGLPVTSSILRSNVSAPLSPVFTQSPSLLPNPAQAGVPVTVNPGAGPSLTWVLLFNGADVRSQVSGGRYAPPTNGNLELRSTITNQGGSVTQAVTIFVTSAATPDPDPVTPDPTFVMGETSFTVTNAGTVDDVDISPTEDGFTVQPN